MPAMADENSELNDLYDIKFELTCFVNSHCPESRHYLLSVCCRLVYSIALVLMSFAGL